MMYRLLQWVPFPVLLFLLTLPALAAESSSNLATKGLGDTAKFAGYTSVGLPELVGKVIQALLSIVGVVFLVLTVYAGVMYMTAGGDPGKVDKAKKILTQSLIGLIIILAAYAFTSFVVTELGKATTATSPEKQ